jgi:hypothetical protein
MPQKYAATWDGRKPFHRVPDSRIRYLAERLHRIGPRALAEFLIEVRDGADAMQRLEVFAELDRYRNFIRANGGDRLPTLRVVGGGGR